MGSKEIPHCPKCFKAYAESRGIPEEKQAELLERRKGGAAGDFIVLVPNQDSRDLLVRIAGATGEVLRQELGSEEAFNPHQGEHLHLTLASPLKALSPEEAFELLKRIKESVSEKLLYDNALLGRMPARAKSDSKFEFQFTGWNYGRHVTLTSGTAKEKDSLIRQLGDRVRSLAEPYVEDGRALRAGNPHFTLGTVSRDAQPKLHKIGTDHSNARKTRRNWDFHQKLHAAATPECHPSYRPLKDTEAKVEDIALKFQRLEIRRLVREHGCGAKHRTVGYLDLKTGQIVMNEDL